MSLSRAFFVLVESTRSTKRLHTCTHREAILQKVKSPRSAGIGFPLSKNIFRNIPLEKIVKRRRGLNPSVVLLPSSSRLASAVFGLGTNFSKATKGFLSDVEELRLFYSNQKSVAISIDSIVFSDGQSMGPDTRHRTRMLKAMVDARRDLSDQILIDTGAFPSFVTKVKGDASNLLDGMIITGPPVARYRHAMYQSTSYARAYRLARAMYVQELEDNIALIGLTNIIEKVKKYKQSNTYPVIQNREEQP